MTDSEQEQLFDDTAYWLSAQAMSHREMMESLVVRRHGNAITKAIDALRNALSRGNFETLLHLESEIQQLELVLYSREPSIMASIEKTQEDLAAGLRDYKQLKENPVAYYARGYRRQDRTGINKGFPLDTMRKALRSQATRVGNFAKNPMLSPEEKKFHLLRVSVLKRAEKLYEELQARVLDAQGDDFQE